MNFRALICLIFTFLTFFAVQAEERLKLSEECVPETGNCKPRVWHIIDRFEDSFINLDEPGPEWKRKEGLPIIIQDIYPPKSSFGTYTLHTKFDIPKSLLESGLLGISFKFIGEVYSIYFNGHLIIKEGETKDGKVTLHRSLKDAVWDINPNYLKEKNNILVIKISGDPRYNGTSIYYSIGNEIGLSFNLRKEMNDRIGVILSFMYLLVGFYHLFLYIKRRSEVYNLHFGIWSVLLFIYFMSRTNIAVEIPIDTHLLEKLEFCILFALFPAGLVFHETLFYNKISRFTIGYSIFSLILILFTIPSPGYIQAISLSIWQISVILVIPFMLYVIIKAMIQKNPDAKSLFLGFIILVIAVIFDTLDSAVFQTGIRVAKYSFLAFIIGIAIILANRFLNLHEQIEEWNNTLEKKVEQRTKELQESLNEIRSLKEQQDGDYFLTTLIIKPLSKNLSKSESIKIEFFISQKKKFEFKKKNHEIGGDICISDTIYLYSKKYTVFINGDAMGKSIQGAGGAIVLGVVFRTAIARTSMLTNGSSMYPEQWLKLAFIELQNVFVSFDGSMLISVVMGLIENDTGMMYYINAEHPWTTLYRDGKAEFIEQELALRKIGMMEVSGTISIRTFRLLKDDSIFIGSDGRDDLLLGNDAEGHRIINEDESLFLKNIEKSKGELKVLYEKIHETGEITDDLSILKITYLGESEISDKVNEEFNNFKEFVKNDHKSITRDQLNNRLLEYESAHPYTLSNFKIQHSMAKSFAKAKNYKKSASYYDSYLETCPWDEKGIYHASIIHKLKGDFQKAIELGERLKLRLPNNATNLINLAEIYKLVGNYERAIKLLKIALRIEPEHKTALQILDSIELRI